MSFSLPGLAGQKDGVEQKLLGFLSFFLTKLQQKYTFNNTYPSHPYPMLLGTSRVFRGGGGGGEREGWLQRSLAGDLLSAPAGQARLDKSSPEAGWEGR